MRASLKIEAVGDNVHQALCCYRAMANEAVPGLGDVTFGKSPFYYWAAKITGQDPVYKYRREFLKPKKDYSLANSKGSRGVFLYFLLDSGFVYEVKTSKGRYFCTVTDDGDIEEISKEQVEQWINEHSESTCLTPPEAE